MDGMDQDFSRRRESRDEVLSYFITIHVSKPSLHMSNDSLIETKNRDSRLPRSFVYVHIHIFM